MTHWSRGLSRSCDKLNSLWLYYQSGYHHQTWQGSSPPWRVAIYKVTWSSYHMILRHHVTRQNHCISTTTVPMAMKLSRMVTYLEGLLTSKSYNTLIKWSCNVTWQTKSIISLLSECLWPPKLTGWYLILMGCYP